MRRRTLLRAAAGAAAIGGIGATTVGGNRGRQEATTVEEGEFSLTSSAWENGETMPTEFTCEGENTSPPLSISNPPEGTEAFALLMDDPDAPNPPFVHWTMWNVPADTRDIPANVPSGETVEELGGAIQGANGTDELGYVGPCPPRDDDQHTYLFELYALESQLDLDPGASYQQVVDAVMRNALGRARYVGQYERAAETTNQ
jgi:Raf kinase inhibitor-like YbhB/YbcL family protein